MEYEGPMNDANRTADLRVEGLFGVCCWGLVGYRGLGV